MMAVHQLPSAIVYDRPTETVYGFCKLWICAPELAKLASAAAALSASGGGPRRGLGASMS
jgi:hypothetical protein